MIAKMLWLLFVLCCACLKNETTDLFLGDDNFSHAFSILSCYKNVVGCSLHVKHVYTATSIAARILRSRLKLRETVRRYSLCNLRITINWCEFFSVERILFIFVLCLCLVAFQKKNIPCVWPGLVSDSLSWTKVYLSKIYWIANIIYIQFLSHKLISVT